MKLIIIEDQEQDINNCKSAIDDFNEDEDINIILDIACSIPDAQDKLKTSYYDGAIVDMKLDRKGGEGNEILNFIKERLSRIPVIIMTGTPDDIQVEDAPIIATYKKGDSYKKIINLFWELYQIGLPKIMGGKGEIEKSLTEIFTKKLLPQVAKVNHKNGTLEGKWADYKNAQPVETEKALLRLTLNHMVHQLYDDTQTCYPEEMYIYPPKSNRITTGSILKNKQLNKFYVVMSPACDLATRPGGGCNTDRALLAEIQMLDEYFNMNISGRDIIDLEPELTSKQKEDLNRIKRNNKSLYYHWLPRSEYFEFGGVINFRWLNTFTETELSDANLFDEPIIQISSLFLKDIVSRFSSYYARQGQPDINDSI